MTSREQQVLALIRKDALISQEEIAAKMRISRSAVAGHVMRLVAKGVIKGRGYVISDKPFAVVVGGANMDICGASSSNLRLQDSNPGKVTSSPGGVARNIAENLARLGVDCRLIAAIGTDHHGDLLVKQGEAAGIDMRYVLRLETEQTSTYVSILDDTGDMLVGVNDMGIVDRLKPETLQLHEQMLRQASIIVADTNLCEEALDYLSGTFIEQPLFIDTVSVAKSVRIKPFLNGVHTLKASRIEAEALCGFQAKTHKQIANLANWFHDRGVSRVLITLGPDGVYYSDSGDQDLQSVRSRNVAIENANGAGDAFAAGAIYAWLNDRTTRDSVRFAISAAEVAMSHLATINPAMSTSAVKRIMDASYSD
jgi:pseudouridine kinase